MANEPGNHWTADHFAQYSLQVSRKYNLKRKVLGLKEITRLKMGGIIGVGQGSKIPPKLIMLEYRSGKKVPTVMLVGKGLTFDSGGISLKPSEGMQDMKYDMCGGSAVLGAMAAIGRMQPGNVDVVAIVPATDNMPGPEALKPGDIIVQYGGKSVEIISTDAEGRLLLADALAYGIEKFKPDAVIDLATLTGAVIIGLGHHRTGLMSNNEGLSQLILSAGEMCGEPLWRLPVGKEYKKDIESKVADLKNVGGRAGGTITAATFLQEFVGETPWAHLDIAGTAWNFTEKSYIPEGPSGTGVRTLIQIIKNWQKTTVTK
jgi:leucyl aminopeptidase